MPFMEKEKPLTWDQVTDWKYEWNLLVRPAHNDKTGVEWDSEHRTAILREPNLTVQVFAPDLGGIVDGLCLWCAITSKTHSLFERKFEQIVLPLIRSEKDFLDEIRKAIDAEIETNPKLKGFKLSKSPETDEK